MRRRSRSKRAGFTLLEVMMAVAVMLVGVMGIVAMQRATFRANSDARTTATATANAARWVGLLHRSAVLWTNTTSVSGVPFLENVGDGWFIPDDLATDPFGMDWYGVPTNAAADVRFCTLVRLQWLTQDRSMRADVITFWGAQGGGGAAFAGQCAAGNGATVAVTLQADSPTTAVVGTNLRMVRTTTVVRRAEL